MGLGVLMDIPNWLRYSDLANDLMVFMFCPLIVANMVSEYTLLPENPNILARTLHRMISNIGVLIASVSVLALLGIVSRVWLVLTEVSIENYDYRFDDNYGFYGITSPERVVFFLLSFWLLFTISGLKVDHDSWTYGRKNFFRFRFFLIVLVLVSIILDGLIGSAIGGSTVHFVTIPLSMMFAWYRFRWALVDVIAKWFIVLIDMLIMLWLGFEYIPKLDGGLQPLAVLGMMVAFLVVAKLSAKLLDWFWMPDKNSRRRFRSDFPLLISYCSTPQQAISKAETLLQEFFGTEVGVNRHVDDVAELIEFDDSPELRVEFSYIRKVFPWFSEPVALANESVLYLHNHLKVLEIRAALHQQEISSRELETLAARAERDAMRAQIRPHFLFNVLNTLHSFIHQQPKQAERIIELLAELMRGVISSASEDTYPLKKEIDLATTYLAIEKIRHGDRLSFNFDIDASLMTHPILPFSIQPLVENAVKYSVDAQLGQAEIQVQAVKDGERLVVTVLDNGPGLSSNTKGGLGVALNNIRERLVKLYDDKGTLILQSVEGGGTQAVLTMPWLGSIQTDDGVLETGL